MIRVSPVFARTAGAVLLCVLCLVLPSCGQAILVAPSGSTITVFVNPPFIDINGDAAVVSALVLEPAGTPVPDGTVVQFFTTLGKIQEQGKTNDGVARVNLVSDTRSGTATVTAISGGSTGTSATATKGSVDVIIGAPRVSRISPFLIDQSINLGQGRTIAQFGVNVLDDKGNPVSNVAVRFSVASDPATDTLLDSTLVFTDNSGNAFGRVQTKRAAAGTIQIRIEVLAPGAPTTAPVLSIPVITGT